MAQSRLLYFFAAFHLFEDMCEKLIKLCSATRFWIEIWIEKKRAQRNRRPLTPGLAEEGIQWAHSLSTPLSESSTPAVPASTAATTTTNTSMVTPTTSAVTPMVIPTTSAAIANATTVTPATSTAIANTSMATPTTHTHTIAAAAPAHMEQLFEEAAAMIGSLQTVVGREEGKLKEEREAALQRAALAEDMGATLRFLLGVAEKEKDRANLELEREKRRREEDTKGWTMKEAEWRAEEERLNIRILLAQL